MAKKRKPVAQELDPQEHMRKFLDDVKNKIKGKVKEPRLSDVALEFLDLCGGITGLAKELHKAYVNPKTPAFVKARVADTMMRALKFYEESKPKASHSEFLTDDELNLEIETTLGEFYGSPIGRKPGVNGTGPVRPGDTASMDQGKTGKPSPQGSASGAGVAESTGDAGSSAGEAQGASDGEGPPEDLGNIPI